MGISEAARSTPDSSFIVPSQLLQILPPLFFVFSRAAPVAYGGSQARGLIRAVAADLRHSNAGSELRLRPTTQLTAMPHP